MKPIAYYSIFVDSLIMIYDIQYGIEDYVIYTYKTPTKERNRNKQTKYSIQKHPENVNKEQMGLRLPWWSGG